MKALKISDIIGILKGELLKGNGENTIEMIRLDSRLIEEGDCFFCLKGEVSDGHNYIESALKKGAKTFVIARREELPRFDGYDVNVILSSDPLISLQDLSTYYMTLMPMKKKVAVTGSVGKTTTRDMMKCVLSAKYRTATTIKNYNTPTGIPESIFTFPLDTEACVIEMGLLFDTTEEALSRFVSPDIAVITNIGVSHMERFPETGRMGILKSKMGVAHFFKEGNTLVLNNDNDLLSQVEKNVPFSQVFVGENEASEYVISDVKDYGLEGIEYKLKNSGREYTVKLAIPGAHNSINSALTIAAGVKAGVSIEDAIDALSRFELPDNRLSVRRKGDMTVIDDCYNAAPESMKSALDTLKSLKGEGRRVAILGDMFELGAVNVEAHREVGRYVKEKDVDLAVFIGKSAKYMHEECPESQYFENLEEFLFALNSNIILKDNDIVLVKASNGMKLSRVVEKILN
ncbi:MAG: UDP-N-acetylmuramoyl-tripeptide--D-alanyl-D-alanine ligase [Clostridia bacterium]|nr:UDP-N-acetylmuramoyl-tripeptide--D-alanyl-D-alanine ligase [Clostridia bacterium]